jgi:hypothetical protein
MIQPLQIQRHSERRCDGCGIPAGADHLRRRTLRLELASRFRPVHIGILILFPAPPASMEQFPYFIAHGSSRPGPANLHATLLAAAGIAPPEIPAAGDALARLQRAGLFVACAVECPLEELGRALTPAALADEFGAEILLRITRSYKPRYIVPLGAQLIALPSILRSAGLSSQLLLDEGRPFDMPETPEAAAFPALRAVLAQTAPAAVARL